ncbi:hypothetical protein E0L36_26560 [Streptomyces sp. AJS327]|uniref:hypothetical protein n=1 Tax=Streptomyces sp. AJS327 TaxID=2545265 RepID=UPI0015DDBAC4|nr:hypothetical protein [Streptomyces sp. AJS327]MBA0054283.1 hypothetical protein [Streptomyces sp. AJS327]
MAYQRISPTLTTAHGVEPVDGVTDPENGNVVTNPTSLVLELENDGEDAVSVTFVTSLTVQGFAVEDLTVELGPGDRRVYGHFSPDVFGPDLAFTATGPLTVRAYR